MTEVPYKGSKGDSYARMVLCLKDWGFPLHRAKALDMFARKGEFRSIDYVGEVDTLEAWEISRQHVRDFKINHPSATVVCCDSVERIQEERKDGTTWDMIVGDSPAKKFGGRWFEHFDFLEDAFYCLTPTNESVIVFNVLQEALFNDALAHRRRGEWYETNKKWLTKEFLVDFYGTFFDSRGADIKNLVFIPHVSKFHSYWVAVYHFKGRSEICHDRFLLLETTAPARLV